jgi:hypothetical protein
MGIREKDRDVGEIVTFFVPVHEDAPPEEAFADFSLVSFPCFSGALELDGPRNARGHQLEEGQKVGATEDATELNPELLGELGIECFAREGEQSWRGVAAAFALCGFRGLDGNEGLSHFDGFDDERIRVELEFDAHHVNDAGGLEIVVRRNEAVLSQIDDVAAGMPDRI